MTDIDWEQLEAIERYDPDDRGRMNKLSGGNWVWYDDLEACALRARKIEAAAVELARASKVSGALLQAEMNRLGGEPFTGTWSITSLIVRSTCGEALDDLYAALAAYQAAKGGDA